MIMLVVGISAFPAMVAISQNPVNVATIVIDVQTEENIFVSPLSFSFELKPGECMESEVDISNTADVGASITLNPIVTPDNSDFDFDIDEAHSLGENSIVSVPFVGCLNPSAVVRPYEVRIGVLR